MPGASKAVVLQRVDESFLPILDTAGIATTDVVPCSVQASR